MAAAAMSAGKVYILTRNAEDAAARLMTHFDRSHAMLLTWETPGDEVFACGFSCRSMLSLRKEAAG